MVKALYLATQDGEFKSTTSLNFDEGGIIGSKHHKNKLQRSVLISSTYSYELVAEHNISIDSGALGENILVDSLDLSLLKPYNRLQIGNVILEITQNCTLCRGLSEINSKLPKLLKDDRGIFAKVIEGGTININDKCILL